ncbi:MAG: KilA-N domain-containing protein [Lewinellaceae bacterium]|nr:KilA-N domain-containing protein [Lewinellaceae bacterium]
MSRKRTIVVNGKEITLLPRPNQEDYISLTDIMKSFDDEFAIYSWLRNRNTVEFIGVWEELHNPDFKGNEFVRFKSEVGLNTFNLTPKKWIEATNAIGMIVKSGRYSGGTFAHQDIAINFCYWLSPTFQLYLIKEFQRLKEEEAERQSLEWNVRRIMSKANYRIHTEAVREHLIPPRLQYTKMEGLYFANEADVLNMALFGITAKEWRQQNPEAKGNIRDNATAEQLLVLSNLQSLNAKLMKWDCDQEQRLQILNEAAIEEMQILVSSTSLKQLPEDEKKKLGRGKKGE